MSVVPVIFLIKIPADLRRWPGNFLSRFCFYFTSCYNSKGVRQFEILQCNSLGVQSWPKFESCARIRRSDLILKSAIVYDFQDSKVLTAIPWRPSYLKFSDGSRSNWRGRDNFRPPFLSTHCSHLLYDATNGLGSGWGRPKWLWPNHKMTERGKPYVRHCYSVRYFCFETRCIILAKGLSMARNTEASNTEC